MIWDKKFKKEKVEMFNLKNVEGQQKFKHITSKQGTITNLFSDKSKRIDGVTNKFLKNLNRRLQQSFKKIRVIHNCNGFSWLCLIFETNDKMVYLFMEDLSVLKHPSHPKVETGLNIK